MDRDTIFNIKICAAITLCVLLVLGFLFWFIPTWNVWSSALSGKAELKQADWNRQVYVQEAKAKKDGAQLLMDAAIVKAKGVAKASIIKAHGIAESNKIIGDSLNKNESYLRYLWIESLQNGHGQVIYVPTEANLPILEAKRLEGKK